MGRGLLRVDGASPGRCHQALGSRVGRVEVPVLMELLVFWEMTITEHFPNIRFNASAFHISSSPWNGQSLASFEPHPFPRQADPVWLPCLLGSR